jgi:transglutaminase-like putative cysteine protease
LRPGAAEKRKRTALKGPESGNWLWQDERRRELPMRTDLKLGAKPEVFVRIVDEEDAEELLKRQLYVRAFALECFEDSVWSPARNGERTLEAGDDGWIRFGDGTGEGILHEVFHGKDPGGRDVFTALQGARAVRLPSLRVTAEGISVLPAASGPAGYEYLASSVPVRLGDLRGKNIEADRLVPGEASNPRIRELALKAAGEGDLVERLRNIENFLRANYGYSLVTRNAKNLEPMENFLFEEKRGHCEFFATAGALMAKELGVEARVAYGWAGGQFFKANNMFVLRAREAHSWVEVKLDGYGWVLMEPTPPVALGGGGAPRVAAADEDFPEPDEVLAETDEAFRQAREDADWESEIRKRFANWLNTALGRQLPLGDTEHRHWSRELERDATYQRWLERDKRWMESLERELDDWQGGLGHE